MSVTRISAIAGCIFFLLSCRAEAQFQSSLPIYYTMHGGLFFPSHSSYEKIYDSSSDLIWGFGIGFPMDNDYFYFIADASWFHSEGFFDASIDSAARIQQRFIHVGVLNKQFFSKRHSVRIQAGVNYITVEQTSSSPLSPEQTTELPKKIGYFGGIGLESIPGDGRISLYADLLYDYRRSRAKELYGDFGGMRLILGLNVYLY